MQKILCPPCTVYILSSVVVDLVLLPLFVRVLCLVLAVLFSTLCLSGFAIILIFCDIQSYVVRPCVWSAVCVCSTS